MLKKFLFCFLGILSLNLFAEDVPQWQLQNSLKTDASTVSFLNIAQDSNYALAAWVEGDKTTKYVYYAYFNGNDWTLCNTPFTGASNVQVGIANGIPVIAYLNSSDYLTVNYFTIDKTTWTLNDSTAISFEDTFESLFLGIKGDNGIDSTTLVVGGTSSDGTIYIYKYRDFANLENFNDLNSWTNINEAETLTDLTFENISMPNQDFAFLLFQGTGGVKTDSILYYYKVDLQNNSLTSGYTPDISGLKSYQIAANADNEAILFYTTSENKFLYYSLFQEGEMSFSTYDPSTQRSAEIWSADFKGNNILCSFYVSKYGPKDSLEETSTLERSYILTGTYNDGTITFEETPQDLQNTSYTYGYNSAVSLVDNYANYIWLEYNGGSLSSGGFFGAFNNLAKTTGWTENGTLDSISSISNWNSYLVVLADYPGTSNGKLWAITALGDSGSIVVRPALLTISESSSLVLSGEKNKYSFLLQEIFGNKITWDLLEDAEYYNVYSDANLSNRLYHGSENYFIDCTEKNSEKTYYVTWVNFEGIEQEAQSIVIPKK